MQTLDKLRYNIEKSTQFRDVKLCWINLFADKNVTYRTLSRGR